MYNKLKQEQEGKNLYQHDELDLRYLLDKIGKGFGAIHRKFRFLIQSVRNRYLLIILFTLVGLGVSYLVVRSTKPYYSSSMTLVLAEIRNQFVENQLQRLSIMIQEDNYQAVAEELDISSETARQIKEMAFSNLDQDIIAEDSVLTGSPFEIQLTLYNPVYFNSLEPAIANYLESNRYFFKQKLIKQREVERMISKLKEDITAMDSVKKAVVSPRGPVNGFVYGQPLDPANLFRESISMYQKQVELEGDLEQLDNIQIVNGFTPRLRPTGPNLLKYLLIGGLIAFLISISIALILESRRRREP
ncbi:subunit length determinant protein [Pontibacter mucosus]|uniref:Subunit length determinant protein n=1 Tax=Pontibacter mucosus TaxID=1649266 RepID=A0A2T5YCT1_9BACT|nr:chain length determinant protein [Pontibacter mucosus]PTX14338.1 subunit length determinant protein [Pontibacter mucosus]